LPNRRFWQLAGPEWSHAPCLPSTPGTP
jgi:hypothetical protein